jgi:pyridoxal phosphate enzyme (YggS family)
MTAQNSINSIDIQTRLAQVRQRIEMACKNLGRDPGGIRLLPVSKTVSPDIMRIAHAAGCREFGENKIQEALEKSQALADLDIKWSVIGHLQTNKVKFMARFAHEFQALDSLKLAAELDKRLQQQGRGMDVFVQINSSAEDSKFGLSPDTALEFVKQLPQFSSLQVKGLMTLAAFSADQELVRACFIKMQELQNHLRQSAPGGLSFDQLSMGMSGDYELAIEHGATVVRVGQAIFGKRSLPDSHYWPGFG